MEFALIISFGILIGCLFGLSWFAGTDAPYIPTKMARIKKLLKEAGLKKGEVFYELGSCDGRVVIEAAKMGAKSFGIEQSWIRVLMSRWKTKNLSNAHFTHGDIFAFLQPTDKHLRGEGSAYIKQNASEVGIMSADIIFIFLLPKGIEKLEPLLKKSLKKGARVITQTFHFKSWKPYKKILITDKNNPNTRLSKDGKLDGDFWIYRT